MMMVPFVTGTSSIVPRTGGLGSLACKAWIRRYSAVRKRAARSGCVGNISIARPPGANRELLNSAESLAVLARSSAKAKSSRARARMAALTFFLFVVMAVIPLARDPVRFDCQTLRDWKYLYTVIP